MALSSSFGQFLFYDVNALLLPSAGVRRFHCLGFGFSPTSFARKNQTSRPADCSVPAIRHTNSIIWPDRTEKRTSSLISPSGGGGRLVSPFFLFFFLFIISFWRTKSSWRMDGTGRRVRRGTPPSVTQSEEIWPYKRRPKAAKQSSFNGRPDLNSHFLGAKFSGAESAILSLQSFFLSKLCNSVPFRHYAKFATKWGRNRSDD